MVDFMLQNDGQQSFSIHTNGFAFPVMAIDSNAGGAFYIGPGSPER